MGLTSNFRKRQVRDVKIIQKETVSFAMHFLSIWIVPGKIKFFNSSREKALRCHFIECWKWEQRNRMLHQIKHLLWFSSHFILFFSNLLFCKAEFCAGNLIILVKICIFVWEFLAQRKATICCNLLSVNSSENAF